MKISCGIFTIELSQVSSLYYELFSECSRWVIWPSHQKFEVILDLRQFFSLIMALALIFSAILGPMIYLLWFFCIRVACQVIESWNSKPSWVELGAFEFLQVSSFLQLSWLVWSPVELRSWVVPPLSCSRAVVGFIERYRKIYRRNVTHFSWGLLCNIVHFTFFIYLSS